MTQMSRRIIVGALGAAAWLGSGSWAAAQDDNPLIAAEERKMSAEEIKQCQEKLHINPKGDRPMLSVHLPPGQTCRPLMKNGFPVPDPSCTPGAVNPTLTISVLKNPDFKTGCVRDQATPEGRIAPKPDEKPGPAKVDTYEWYDATKPDDNSGQQQVCELDHLISLEIGGADTLDNIWPQCGPANVTLNNRFFKEKDTVENYLAWMVRHDQMDLEAAQKGIASDWTQFLEDAEKKCPKGNCPKDH